MVFGKLPPPGFKKFTVGKDPIETEKSRQEWGAPPDWKQKFVTDKIRETMKKLRVGGDDVSKAKLQAIEFYCMQQEIVSHSEEADTQVMGEFRDFLLGKSKYNEDTNVIPWGKRKLVGEDIDAYLEAVMTAKFEYDKKIGMMRDFGMAPRTLEDAWLYFCFHILKRDIPEELYLKTWAQFYPAGAISKGYTDAREARDEERREHGGDVEQESEAIPSRKMGYKENSVTIRSSFSGSTLMDFSENEGKAGRIFDFFAGCDDTLDRVDEGPRTEGDAMVIDQESVHVRQPRTRQRESREPETGAGGATERSSTRSGLEYGFPFDSAEFSQMLTASIENAITPTMNALGQAIGANSEQIGILKETIENSMLKQTEVTLNVEKLRLDDDQLREIRELAFENTKALATAMSEDIKNNTNRIGQLMAHNHLVMVDLANKMLESGKETRGETIAGIVAMRDAVIEARNATLLAAKQAEDARALDAQRKKDDEGSAGAAAVVAKSVTDSFNAMNVNLQRFQVSTVNMLNDIRARDPVLVDAIKSMVEKSGTDLKNIASDINAGLSALKKSDSIAPVDPGKIAAVERANEELKQAVLREQHARQAQEQSSNVQLAYMNQKIAQLEKTASEEKAKTASELEKLKTANEKEKNEILASIPQRVEQEKKQALELQEARFQTRKILIQAELANKWKAEVDRVQNEQYESMQGEYSELEEKYKKLETEHETLKSQGSTVAELPSFADMKTASQQVQPDLIAAELAVVKAANTQVEAANELQDAIGEESLDKTSEDLIFDSPIDMSKGVLFMDITSVENKIGKVKDRNTRSEKDVQRIKNFIKIANRFEDAQTPGLKRARKEAKREARRQGFKKTSEPLYEVVRSRKISPSAQKKAELDRRYGTRKTVYRSRKTRAPPVAVA